MRSSAIAWVVLSTVMMLGCQPPVEPVLRPEPATRPAPASTAPAATMEVAPVRVPASAPATAPVAATLPTEDFGREQFRLVSERDEIVSVLENGLTVVVRRVATPVCSVRGYVNTGSIYEGKWLGGGLSHLLEHLVAGGTNARRTEAENRDLLQKIGNNSNAYTTQDNTSYFVNTASGHMEEAVDLVTGWMLGAKITQEEFEREREVVQRELELDLGEPESVFGDLLDVNRYRVSPARVPVIGYQAVIQKLTRDDVFAYYQQAYQPGNMVLAVAGNIDPQRMLEAVRKCVADAPPGRVFSHNIEAEPPLLAPRTLVATFPKLGSAKLSLGFPSVKLTDPDMYALDLLSQVLGQGESAILVQELRDNRQLASKVAAYDWTPHFVEGTFHIVLDLPPDKIEQATAAVWEQIEGIKKNGVNEDRLNRAKVQAKTSRAFSMQTAESVASSLAYDMLSTGDPHFSDKYVERIGKVTSDEVKAAARKYLDRSRLVTTALLPAEEVGKDLPKAVDLLRAAVPTSRPATQPADAPTLRIYLGKDTTLLVRRIATSPVVAIRMYSLGGLTAEDEKTNGMGNMAMLMVQRGTKTRKGEQIAEFFDSIGSQLETSCGNNSWSWSTNCLAEDLDKTLDVFADVVRNPSFPELEMAALRQRVMASIQEQDSDWFSPAMRFFRQSYFGATRSPYQFVPIGTRENVPKFSAADLRKWYEEKVLPAPKVLAIYGDIDVEKAKELAKARFGAAQIALDGPAKIQAGSLVVSRAMPPSVDVRAVRIQKTDNTEAGVIVGFDAEPIAGDPDGPAMLVAKTMVSGYSYPTGYLFETLRGKKLVYDVNASLMPGCNNSLPGTFFAYAGCDPRNVNEVVDLILLNIGRLQGSEKDLQRGWFERAKQLLIVADAVDDETAGAQAASEAVNELLGLGYDFHARFIDKVNAVKLEDVQRLARVRLSRCMVTITTKEPQLVTIKAAMRQYREFPPIELTPGGVQHDK